LQSDPTLQILLGPHFGQVPPQSTSLSVPLSAVSVQVGAWQIFALHTALAQSLFATQARPVLQSGQAPPPQSTAVSAPSFFPSEHAAIVQTEVLQSPV
jgi:hypothetical protein